MAGNLKAELGIPKSIREAGVQEADSWRMWINCLKMHSMTSAPAQPALPTDLRAETDSAGYLLRRDYVEGETAAKKEAAPAKAEKKRRNPLNQ